MGEGCREENDNARPPTGWVSRFSVEVVRGSVGGGDVEGAYRLRRGSNVSFVSFGLRVPDR